LLDVDQRGLVALRHEGAKRQAAGKPRAGRQAEIVDDDGDIVALIELDVAGLLGGSDRLVHARPLVFRRVDFVDPDVNETRRGTAPAGCRGRDSG